MPASVEPLPAVPAVRGLRRAAERDLRNAPVGALPRTLSPQLATLVDAPPGDVSQWLWELKFDGYRMLARVERGAVQLITRNGNDWTELMPDLAEAVRHLPLQSGWLDGEVLVLDTQGVPDFQALQNAFDSSSTRDLVYYVFDLPYADGRDLRSLPLVERRELLRSSMEQLPGDRVRFSEAFDARPQDLVASACKLGFEGVIGKRRSAPYASRRTADWIKLKCSRRQEFVIGGFTDPQGSRTGLGSLLLGVHDEHGSLQYAGNVGTGFNERTLAELREKLGALTTDKSPFVHLRAVAKKAHWVQPRLLAEVSFAEWTKDHRIRHSVFHGLRDDKPPEAIVRERPQHVAGDESQGAGSDTLTAKLRISNPDRVIDGSARITKIELVRYYARVAPLMMEHLRGRPVALVRAPDGLKGELFFQKHLERASIDGFAQLDAALHEGHPSMLEVVRPEGVVAGAQMNVVEYHTWNAKKDKIDRPDRMTFDLDPGEGTPWSHVQEAAQLVQVLLEELGLPAYLKTSGGKALHVVVPIKRLYDWDRVKRFSQAVVQHLAGTIPQRFVAKSGARNRIGKIFVDYLRNGEGATTVSAWSARARPGMGISVPVAWPELGELTSGAHWTIRTVDDRLRLGNSPWAGYEKSSASLSRAAKLLGYPADA